MMNSNTCSANGGIKFLTVCLTQPLYFISDSAVLKLKIPPNANMWEHHSCFVIKTNIGFGVRLVCIIMLFKIRGKHRSNEHTK